jgi:hypothetical protein
VNIESKCATLDRNTREYIDKIIQYKRIIRKLKSFTVRNHVLIQKAECLLNLIRYAGRESNQLRRSIRNAQKVE